MNTLNGYSKNRLTNDNLLTAAGGHIPLGNANGNVPISNGVKNVNLNADKLDGYHIEVTSSPGTDSSTLYFVL